MAKIIKLEETEVVIASKDHSAIRVAYDALDFKPKLGDHVEIYHDDDQVIVLKVEATKAPAKPFYQQMWFWLVLLVLVGLITYLAGKGLSEQVPATEPVVESQVESPQVSSQLEASTETNEKLAQLITSLQEEIANLKLKVEELKNKLEEQQNQSTDPTQKPAETTDASQ
ncbi:hypothetical protein I6N95_04660 [Vagococcus sp. BWB3-3]|uniref:Uncharacterized protein n=1 Tax=Vagococcus allomyrinae TaxID=2794353 RepID=A0A940P900_9ENTE|nr:hypothetical protein [Vagococcus allomyrinae]MBP1040300.1 hypothetical protein [Vagococcus allomyrinae]